MQEAEWAALIGICGIAATQDTCYPTWQDLKRDWLKARSEILKPSTAGDSLMQKAVVWMYCMILNFTGWIRRL